MTQYSPQINTFLENITQTKGEALRKKIASIPVESSDVHPGSVLIVRYYPEWWNAHGIQRRRGSIQTFGEWRVIFVVGRGRKRTGFFKSLLGRKYVPTVRFKSTTKKNHELLSCFRIDTASAEIASSIMGGLYKSKHNLHYHVKSLRKLLGPNNYRTYVTSRIRDCQKVDLGT